MPVRLFESLSIDFTSFPILLLAIGMGPWAGSLSAILAHGFCIFESPLPCVLTVLQALLVGALAGKSRWSPLLSVTLFWALIGIPALWLFSGKTLQSLERFDVAVLFSYLVNGIVCVMPAEFIIYSGFGRNLGFAGVRRRYSLRMRVFNLSLLLAGLPVLAVSLLNAKNYYHRAEANVSQILQTRARFMATQIAGYIDYHLGGMGYLASDLSRLSLEDRHQLQERLETFHQNHRGYLTTLVTNEEGLVISADPAFLNDGTAIVEAGISVKDRDYFQVPMHQPGTYVSDVFLGRGFGRDPIVAISAPIGEGETFKGIVEGSLNLQQFEQFIETETGEHFQVTILDQHDRVIFSGPKPLFQPLASLSGSAMLSGRQTSGGSDIYLYEEGDQAWFVAVAAVQSRNWTVYAKKPAGEVLNELSNYFLFMVLWIFLAMLIALFIAPIIVDPIAKPLERLRHAFIGFGENQNEPTAVDPRSSYSPEVNELITHFNDLAQRLRFSYQRLEDTLADKSILNEQLSRLAEDLEMKVLERTKELEKATRIAEEANHSKSRFLANMSHEIRTPMNGVLGMIRLLEDSKPTAEQKEYLEVASGSCRALLGIINDILDFSKIEAGKVDLENEPLDLRECVEESLNLCASAVIDRDVELLYDIEPSVPEVIMGDVTRLRQVLVNLVGNAVKFTEKGWVKVAVVKSEVENQVIVQVRDTGIGIPEDRVDKLFQPFSQVDASTTRKFGGTGLGLVICKGLCRLMGGDIRVRSVLNEGSVFEFELDGEPAPATMKTDQDSLRIPSGDLCLWTDHQPFADMFRALCAARSLGAQVFRPNEAPNWETVHGVVLDVERLPRDRITELVSHAREAGRKVLLACKLGSKSPRLPMPLPDLLHKPIRLRSFLRSFGLLEDPPVPAIESLSMESFADCRPMSILLVDDNRINQTIAVRFLKKLGYDPDVADNGQRAVDAFTENYYDLIFMDVQMPVMDGLEATRAIRRRFPESEVRIVALTAHAMKDDIEICRGAGMDDHISKPLSFEELKRVLERAADVVLKNRSEMSS